MSPAPPRPDRRATWRRLLRGALRVAVALLVVLALAAGGAFVWFHHRTPPPPLTQRLFRGVTYTREVTPAPAPVVLHIVTIAIGTPGLAFFVTPGDPARALPLDARTTSDFLREFDLQLAINGDFFSPWYSSSPVSYYPHRGDPVGVDGVAASNGVVYSQNRSPRPRPTLRFSRDHRPSFTLPLDQAFNAISGEPLVDNGQLLVKSHHDPGRRQPRTAVALDREATRLFLLVVDGRQPSYSDGLTLRELGEAALRVGGWTAVNLDGGGSTALIVEDAGGAPAQLNSPIHTRVPGRERPVANHLGIRAVRE